MSFLSDFKTIIEADGSINAYVTGGIKFGHLPDDFDISKTWLVWDFKLNQQFDTMNFNNSYSAYGVSITVSANDSVVMNNLSDRVVDYLNGKSTSNFPDIHMVSDNKSIVLSKPYSTYQDQLEFDTIYVG